MEKGCVKGMRKRISYMAALLTCAAILLTCIMPVYAQGNEPGVPQVAQEETDVAENEGYNEKETQIAEKQQGEQEENKEQEPVKKNAKKQAPKAPSVGPLGAVITTEDELRAAFDNLKDNEVLLIGSDITISDDDDHEDRHSLKPPSNVSFTIKSDTDTVRTLRMDALKQFLEIKDKENITIKFENIRIQGWKNDPSQPDQFGGVQLYKSSNITLDGLELFDVHVNYKDFDGALNIYQCQNVTLKNSKIYNNKSVKHYGGLRIQRTDIKITNCEVYGNEVLSDSTDHLFGGGMYIHESNVTIDGNSKIYNNKLTNTSSDKSLITKGSGIFVTERSTVAIKGDTVISNHEAQYGGAIYSEGNSDIMVGGNAVLHNNSAVCTNEQEVKGGAIYQGAGELEIGDNAQLKNNYAVACEGKNSMGGAVYIESQSHFSATGNALFEKNAAKLGGAVYLSENCAIADIDGEVVFKDNYATKEAGQQAVNYDGDAGAIYADKTTLSIKNGASFINNNASYGGAIYLKQKVKMTAESATFHENRAQVNGGAVYSYYNESEPEGVNEILLLGDTDLTQNRSGQDGGAIYRHRYGLKRLIAGKNVAFNDNSAFENCRVIEPEDQVTHKENIETSDFTGDFQYAYNNYDVSYKASARAAVQVNYYYNYGSKGIYTTQQVTGGAKTQAPQEPTRAGYVFKGWYKDTDCTQAWDFDTIINGQTNLYAKWVKTDGTKDGGTDGGDGQNDTTQTGSSVTAPNTADNSNFFTWVSLVTAGFIAVAFVVARKNNCKIMKK